MGRRRERSGAGFSLIELLIVVAILAALVGTAVPWFQDNLAEAQRTKALRDLAEINRAIVHYEQKEGKLLLGTSLGPLLGRYMQEIPPDPWGNPYLWDGAVGFLGTYGADTRPGGSGGDADSIVRGMEYRGTWYPVAPVFLTRAQYRGAWGPPRPPLVNGTPDFRKFDQGNSFVLQFTRSLVEARDWNLPSNCIYLVPAPPSMIATDMSGGSFPADTWRSAASWFFALSTGIDPLHKPKEGTIVLRCGVGTVGAAGGPWQPIRPDARFSFHDSTDISYAPGPFETTYTASIVPASPLDPAVYGPEAVSLLPPVLGPPPVADPLAQGVRIERY